MELATAEYFVSRYAGASFTPSRHARDLDAVAADPRASEAFETLTMEGSPAGRLYGLCGLYLTDLARFLQLRDRMRLDGRETVRLSIGCSSRDATLSSVADQVFMGCSALGL